MKKNINEWLDEYAESHKNPINKIIHWICVPLITITLLGLLSLIDVLNNDLYNINLASIFIVFALIFYFRLSITLAIGMLFLTGTTMHYLQIFKDSYLQQNLILIYLIIFAISWVGQFIGHKIEGKKPSFFKDIQFLLIGPVWLLSFIYKKLNIKI